MSDITEFNKQRDLITKNIRKSVEIAILTGQAIGKPLDKQLEIILKLVVK